MAPNFKKAAKNSMLIAAAGGAVAGAARALKPHIGTIASKVRRRKAANTGDRSVQNVSFRDDNKDNGDKA